MKNWPPRFFDKSSKCSDDCEQEGGDWIPQNCLSSGHKKWGGLGTTHGAWSPLSHRSSCEQSDQTRGRGNKKEEKFLGDNLYPVCSSDPWPGSDQTRAHHANIQQEAGTMMPSPAWGHAALAAGWPIIYQGLLPPRSYFRNFTTLGPGGPHQTMT